MTSETREIPFVKQLASSDRKIREKALESLRTYLFSNRNLTELDLLKLWRGLFFCLYHTPNPAPQHALCLSFASLLHPLTTTLFTRFLTAFWSTIISEYTSIPQLRLDKYLLLIRCYISSTFAYLADLGWDEGLIQEWRDVMEGNGKEGLGGGLGPLSPANGKVPDGIRYHVLDVWVDELVRVVKEKGMVSEEVRERLMAPVKRLEKEGRTKVVRGRAKDVLADERIGGLISSKSKGAEQRNEEEEEEFEGFED